MTETITTGLVAATAARLVAGDHPEVLAVRASRIVDQGHIDLVVATRADVARWAITHEATLEARCGANYHHTRARFAYGAMAVEVTSAEQIDGREEHVYTPVDPHALLAEDEVRQERTRDASDTTETTE